MKQPARILTAVAVCWFILAGTSAFAQGTVITKAVPDFSNLAMPQVIIHGDSFGTTPQVTLGDDLGNLVPLATPTQYQTDRLVATGTPTPEGFTMFVRLSGVSVYNKKTGPIGEICVGDMVFTLTTGS